MKFVEDEKINAQINHIFKLNGLEKTDQQIAEFFMHNKEMNFKINKIQWSEDDIKNIRKDFEVRYNVWKKSKEHKINSPMVASSSTSFESQDKPVQNVVITDIKMPFESMVIFMVKWAIASIPALIILMVLVAMTVGFIGGLIK